MENFWTACLLRLEADLPPQQFNTWIKGLRLEPSVSTSTLVLYAPNRWVMNWVRERCLPQIEAVASDYFHKPMAIELAYEEIPAITDNTPEPLVEKIDAPESIGQSSGSGMADSLSNHANNRFSSSVRISDPVYDKTRLNPEFTFDTLVTGRANDLARAAAHQVAQNPGTSYNPLFIYGGVGLGKTHLIHAIGNAIHAENPHREIRYVHSEDYFSDVVKAFQQKSFESFKRYYRSLDLLMIDDIQFFNKKERTQEEFFYAFNALVENKKQIIITCDTYPKDIQGLEDRLISRFDWGLTVAIEPPELEMRVAILKKKAEAENTKVSDDVAFLIAKNLRSNVRELEGALNRVIAYARFHGRDINIEVAKDALRDILGATNRQISLELIQKTVADYYRIKVSDMFSQRRNRAIARPRQVAMWLARELTDRSLPEIGDAFGGRDHTTVLHACRTIGELRFKDTVINNDIHVLMQTIKG